MQYDINKLQKYQPYHQAKLINMNILHTKKILPSNQKQIMEQAKFTYSPLGKAFVEQKQLKNKERNKSKQLKVIIAMISNYCFQRKEKF